VAWADAAAYCAWRGGRLPTETEWERAAAGAWPEHRQYVWGDASLDGSSPNDRTPEGIEDLAGGVAEWVLDGGEFYPAVPRIRDAALDGDASLDGGEAVDVPERNEAGFYVLRGWRGDAHSPWRVVRGGFEALPLARRTTTARRFRQPGDRLPWVGFRCAYGEP
jgi:formylglycine-generating enzyme required for sulfatase activity